MPIRRWRHGGLWSQWNLSITNHLPTVRPAPNTVFGDPDPGVAKACFYLVSAGSTHFQHLDGQSTERAVTSYNGSVEGWFTSLPFGDGYSASGSDSDPYHFAMLDKDYYGSSDSGTDHAKFRLYSDTQGRWMSPDPYSGEL